MKIQNIIKSILILSSISFSIVVFQGCDEDDDVVGCTDTTANNFDADATVSCDSCCTYHHSNDFDYHAHIHSPDSTNKHVGDTIHIHVEFEDHNGGTVHNVQVRIYNKADTSNVVYDAPVDGHVHSATAYEHHDNFILNVSAHTDWILEASVWSHDISDGVTKETVEFHVHP